MLSNRRGWGLRIIYNTASSSGGCGPKACGIDVLRPGDVRRVRPCTSRPASPWWSARTTVDLHETRRRRPDGRGRVPPNRNDDVECGRRSTIFPERQTSRISTRRQHSHAMCHIASSFRFLLTNSRELFVNKVWRTLTNSGS